MEWVEGNVCNLAWRQIVNHQAPIFSSIHSIPHLSIRCPSCHPIGIEWTSRQRGDHAKAQTRTYAQGQVVTHRFPNSKRSTLHAIHALCRTPRHLGVCGVKHDWCIPRFAVFGINAFGEVNPIRFRIPRREAYGKIRVLYRRDSHIRIIWMVQCGEAISAAISRPIVSHRSIARTRAIVLGASRIPTRSPWNVCDVIKLPNGQGLNVLPGLAVVSASVCPSIGGQNQFIWPNPLQIVFVRMNLIRPPFRPHAFPRGPAVQGVPQLNTQHADVVEIPWVHAHF